MKRLLAIEYIDDCISKIYEDNEKYFELNRTKEIEITKLQVTEKITNYWSLDSVKNLKSKKLKDGTFKTIKVIPIYDWISVELFGYGKTEKESINDVDNKFKYFCDYHDKYEQNMNRNKKNFMQKIKKFGFLPKQRDFMDVHIKTFEHLELVYFKDNDLDFRENAILNGVPSDARADDPIFGYVYENKLIFFKSYFIKGQKENFEIFIKEHYKEIANHYNLKNYTLYEGVISPYYYFVDKNNCLLDSLTTDDYEYYKEGILLLKVES